MHNISCKEDNMDVYEDFLLYQERYEQHSIGSTGDYVAYLDCSLALLANKESSKFTNNMR